MLKLMKNLSLNRRLFTDVSTKKMLNTFSTYDLSQKRVFFLIKKYLPIKEIGMSVKIYLQRRRYNINFSLADSVKRKVGFKQ